MIKINSLTLIARILWGRCTPRLLAALILIAGIMRVDNAYCIRRSIRADQGISSDVFSGRATEPIYDPQEASAGEVRPRGNQPEQSQRIRRNQDYLQQELNRLSKEERETGQPGSHWSSFEEIPFGREG